MITPSRQKDFGAAPNTRRAPRRGLRRHNAIAAERVLSPMRQAKELDRRKSEGRVRKSQVSAYSDWLQRERMGESSSAPPDLCAGREASFALWPAAKPPWALIPCSH